MEEGTEKNVPADANVVTGRFLLCVRNNGTQAEDANIRFVVHGYKYIDKVFLARDVTSMRQVSTKTLVMVAALLLFFI